MNKELQELPKAREARRMFLMERIHELYSNGKKPSEIAKKLGISETRVHYYLHEDRKLYIR